MWCPMEMRQRLVARLILVAGGCGRRGVEGWAMAPGPGSAPSDHGRNRRRLPPSLCLLAQVSVRPVSQHC